MANLTADNGLTPLTADDNATSLTDGIVTNPTQSTSIGAVVEEALSSLIILQSNALDDATIDANVLNDSSRSGQFNNVFGVAVDDRTIVSQVVANSETVDRFSDMAETTLDSTLTILDARSVSVDFAVETTDVLGRDWRIPNLPGVVIAFNGSASRSNILIERVDNLITLTAIEYAHVEDQQRTSRVWRWSATENMVTLDSSAIIPSLGLRESLTVADSYSKTLTKTFAEAFSAADDVDIGSLLRLDVNETFQITDDFSLTLNKRFTETLGVRDLLLQNANATFSELKFLDRDVNEAEFERLLMYGGPVGYKDFKRFIAGDYSYQNAMLRYAFRSERNDIARLNTCQIVVDVPDVQDRGFADCVDTGWTTVTFNRHFYTPPEVQVTLKSGVTIGAIPEIEAATLTNTSFNVRLKTAGNSFVAGRVSWSALGY